MVIEKSFGLLKRRFPALRHGIRLKHPEDICILITSALVLHNFLIEKRESEENLEESSADETASEENNIDGVQFESHSGSDMRQLITRNYFG